MSAFNSHQAISKEATMAGFPDANPTIEGKITPKELLRVFRHLIECIQSTTAAYHDLNFLFWWFQQESGASTAMDLTPHHHNGRARIRRTQTPTLSRIR